MERSHLAYEDVKAALERAMESPRGVLIRFATKGKATNFVARANYYRRQDRKENFKTFPEGHPFKFASAWDILRVVADGEVVTITKGDGSNLNIEEL
jgi:hypothetical protein